MAKSFFKILSDIVSSFSIWPNTDYRRQIPESKTYYDKNQYGFSYGDSVMNDALKDARREFLNDIDEDCSKHNAIKFIKRCNSLCVSFESPNTAHYVVLTVQDVYTINYVKDRNLQRISGDDVFDIAYKLSEYISKL